jgi:hypothetical protein
MVIVSWSDFKEQVRSIVRQFAPDAAEDIESLIFLGRLEQNPPTKG